MRPRALFSAACLPACCCTPARCAPSIEMRAATHLPLPRAQIPAPPSRRRTSHRPQPQTRRAHAKAPQSATNCTPCAPQASARSQPARLARARVLSGVLPARASVHRPPVPVDI
ncbi:hypothetical protein HYPSUDRAFT_550630 [Hypholoma sublateritium FD-334 SS-4]|uniref:Secreted protein n=1 Tax=Hypholoma sublateritium (strain FD-334 SS-4) TaxID=945553 RepID=A0A0D2LA09_HYPSF|nr:hypothetical protein HYPSUDRAFT_550630 [Hypholoma sublateritium FD-334 SS-4]